MSSKSRFQPNTRKYVLEWPEGHELHGLVITARAMRMGELERLGSLSDEFEAVGDDADDGQNGKRLGLLGDMLARFGKVLVSWNRVDVDTMHYNDDTDEFEETPETKLLPANVEGLRALEDWEFMAVLAGYMRCAVGVSDGLGKGSTSGQLSQVELPMTEL